MAKRKDKKGSDIFEIGDSLFSFLDDLGGKRPFPSFDEVTVKSRPFWRVSNKKVEKLSPDIIEGGAKKEGKSD